MEHYSWKCGACEPCCHVYVSVERILVHEWARFRWGVFNEYPDAGEPGFYFSTITGHVEPIRCALSINGVLFNTSTTRSYCSGNVTNPTTGLFPEECEFRAYPAGPSQSVCKASLMDRVTINPVSVIEVWTFFLHSKRSQGQTICLINSLMYQLNYQRDFVTNLF